MTKQLLVNLKRNFQIFNIGLAFSAMGLLLWTDHKYFFWPPQYAGLMNDDGLDAIAVAVGVGLMYYALKNEENNTLAGILLSVAAGFTSLVACIQLIHAIFAGRAPMGLGFILSCFLLTEILYTARTRNTR
ncbi:hypothetical protein [Lactobacillus gasseri]|uniref:hypothetical protein n=1 Tax=Lactobacillus gasseri TaxID=1596 RepID=UPI0020742D94|nr:hypothetical protein [Lactobacillus gasseri]MCT7894385.1 hypothetical protein [Lactobacillus gasseri]MCZ9726903.1 hypothetical protein [Lactobacillus gasseri]MDX5065763.1 hypothetical protein [Lactobacillus gasseri]MDX5082464.1 hypothetical protein [Lactobacillus gasseri]